MWDQDPGEASDQLESRYKIVVEIIVVAPSAEDAEIEVNEVIHEGMLALMSEDENRETRIFSYDITESDPAEVI